MGQEILLEVLEMQRQSEESERQLQFVNEQIADLENFEKALENLSEENANEILAPIGRGIFMKAEKKNDEKLFVEVGAGVVVRKTPEETRKIISEQILKFKEARVQILSQLEILKNEFGKMLLKVEKFKEDAKKSK